MKTTENKTIEKWTNETYLSKIENLFETIENLLKNNKELSIKGEETLTGTKKIDLTTAKFLYREIFTNDMIGSTSKKKLRRLFWDLEKKTSIKKINIILNYLYKVRSRGGQKNIPHIHIVNKKHEKIQQLKKEWKKAQVIADAAYKAYKEEKGDYYKTQRVF